MPEELAREGLRVRGRVEHLVRGDAGERARGDVPEEFPHASRVVIHDLHHAAHRGLGAVRGDEVELEVLARRDVGEAAQQCSSATSAIASKRGGEHALRDLHPLHVVLGLALAVGAVEEAELPPGLGADLAALSFPSISMNSSRSRGSEGRALARLGQAGSAWSVRFNRRTARYGSHECPHRAGGAGGQALETSSPSSNALLRAALARDLEARLHGAGSRRAGRRGRRPGCGR